MGIDVLIGMYDMVTRWIKGSVVVAKTWGDGLKELGGFYRSRRATIPANGSSSAS
jgi:hypothetical protein